MEIKDVIVEEIDILKTMETLNERLRKSVSSKLTEEQMQVYDIGVKNTMNCLETLITHQGDGEKNRLIYQKYGETTEVCEYRKLSDILQEAENKEAEKRQVGTKRLFISQPMRGKTDEEITVERNRIIGEIAERYGGIEVIDSFFTEDAPDGVNSGLYWLGKSLELLATADCAYFADGWEEYRGCKIEHECAVQYGIEIVGE